MKKTIYTLIGIIACSMATAQVTSGTIQYTESMKLRLERLESPELQQFRHMIPKEHKNQKVLYFNPSSSLYVSAPTVPAASESEIRHEEGGAQIRIQAGGPKNDKIFTDLAGNQRIEERDLMGRKFLVTGELGKNDWKLTGNQKMILGYPCQEAVLSGDTTEKTVAWFTPAIPVSSGPAGLGGLPGMILELSLRDGMMVMTATELKKGEVPADVMVKPKEGKKVTSEEFKKIAEEKRKEMQEQFGGSGNMIIKMEVDRQ